MNRVYWDTMMFIYLQEGHPEFGPLVRKAYMAIERRRETLCTSVFTIGELLTLPRRKSKDALVRAIRESMLSGEVEILPFTLATAEMYSLVRSRTKLKAADSIHLAAAAESGARTFVTNDEQLLKLQLDGIPQIVGLDGRLW